jgi:hypothetical protein
MRRPWEGRSRRDCSREGVDTWEMIRGVQGNVAGGCGSGDGLRHVEVFGVKRGEFTFAADSICIGSGLGLSFHAADAGDTPAPPKIRFN